MKTVTVTFVQATFVLATFVHTKHNTAITDPILTKLFVPNFVGSKEKLVTQIILTYILNYLYTTFESGLKTMLSIKKF